MTNEDAAVVLTRVHIRERHKLARVDLKRSLDSGERLRWRNSITFELLALEHAHFALTGRRMYVQTAANKAANDR